MNEVMDKMIKEMLVFIMLGAEIQADENHGVGIYKIDIPEHNEFIENYDPLEVLKDIKQTIQNCIYDICEAETDEEKADIDQLYKVYGRVKEETWTLEKFNNMKEQIDKEMSILKEYEEQYKEI